MECWRKVDQEMTSHLEFSCMTLYWEEMVVLAIVNNLPS